METYQLLEFCARTNNLFHRRWDVLVKSLSLTETEFNILVFLGNRPHQNTAKDFCRIRAVKSGIVSTSVEKLVQNGYVTRETDPTDRRKQLLFLTEKAEPFVKEGQKLIDDFYGIFTKPLSSEELFSFEEKVTMLLKQIDTIETAYNSVCHNWGETKEES